MNRKEVESFKEWYEFVKDENANEIPVFNREVRILFSQCSENGKMNLCELLKLTSDSAVEDYAMRGMTWRVLAEKGYAILTSRQSYHFYRLPETDEKILLTTWEETPEPLQLIRRYKISTDKGELLISGHSAWLVVNPSTRRIVRPSDFTLRQPVPKYTVDFDGIPTGKIAVPENLTVLNQRPICFTDTDSNGHTNNSRYGAFVLDCLPVEYQKKNFTDFRINYSKEAVKGQMLQMFASFDDDSKKITIVGKNGETTCFEAELYYV